MQKVRVKERCARIPISLRLALLSLLLGEDIPSCIGLTCVAILYVLDSTDARTKIFNNGKKLYIISFCSNVVTRRFALRTSRPCSTRQHPHSELAAAGHLGFRRYQHRVIISSTCVCFRWVQQEMSSLLPVRPELEEILSCRPRGRLCFPQRQFRRRHWYSAQKCLRRGARRARA